MAAAELVGAIGDKDEGVNRVDPPTEQPQDVERRLVGPVHVFEHEDGPGSRPELIIQRRSDLVRLRPALDELFELSAGLLRDVQERSERTRREERVACSPEDAHRVTLVVEERPHESGLADARLAPEEEQPSALRPRGVEMRQQFLALE
jgi:hypothetical protein